LLKASITSFLIIAPFDNNMVISSFDIYTIHYLKGNVHKKMRFFKK
jgi:hypothetical protein